MNKTNNGLLISIEGIDGSGKSSLAYNLTQKCHEAGYPIILTKEPGGTPFGMRLRPLLNYQEEPLAPRAEFLCFAADRAHHFEQLILPALSEGKIVISDRLADSSLVYQGYGRGLDCSMIQTVNAWAMQNRFPDIIFYLKIDPQKAIERIIARNATLTSFEKEVAFVTRTAEGFEQLVAPRKEVLTLDALEDQEKLADQAFLHVQQWRQAHNL